VKILSFKPGHDGSVSYLKDGVLQYSLEAERDSFPRYSHVTPSVVVEAMERTGEIPDVVCLSGWLKGVHSFGPILATGYFGWDSNYVETRKMNLFGKEVDFFSSSHERSHLFSSLGMSTVPVDQPCYALVWEGSIGSFYEMSPQGDVKLIVEVLEHPGNKYQYGFPLANPKVPDEEPMFKFEYAGKVMALAGYADNSPLSQDEIDYIDYILKRQAVILRTPKSTMRSSPFYNIGVESQKFKNLAARMQDAIFDRFYEAARKHLRNGYPLLVSGGCGLNCDWNSKWRECGLFSSVFVPPITSDAGSAVGTAVDAHRHFTGETRIEWSVYAGNEFYMDTDNPEGFTVHPLDYDDVACRLDGGAILAWVHGRYEIGPRALGNRSLLASPFDAEVKDKLNKIKQREDYRPIAPVCIEEDVSTHFDWQGESPHMLYFQRVTADNLRAVTHVDGTARIQTLRRDQNAHLYALLLAFKRRTGYGVLANTSLNFKGRGFINRMSDLAKYSIERGLDGFALEDRLYLPKQ
jgi:predicted NodU family carbamoyl transferase